LAKPRLRLLDEEQIQLVHLQALRILKTTGVRIDSPRILQLLKEEIGPSSIDQDRVLIPPELVEWAIERAPAVIEIYDRLGVPAFHLGEGRTRFGIGVTALYYQDPSNDANLIPFNRKHMQDMVRLGGLLPNYDVISTVGILHDLPPEIADLAAVLEMVANTTKPLVLLVSDENLFPTALDLVENLVGNLAERPYLIPYLNPLTPLVFNLSTLEKMEHAILRGLPVIFSSYSMMGMSTPIRPAGTLALLLAEQWAGLLISQLIRPGAPVVLSMLPAYFDMKTMVSFYDPLSMLINLACGEILAYFQLPHCSSSGSGTGWGPDLLALETYWMNHLTTGLLGGSLAPFVGDTLGAKAFSPVTVVYIHELIRQVLNLTEGFSLEPGDFCLDEIHQVGPGGDFLTAPSTLADFRHAYYQSRIFSRQTLEKWQSEGSPSAMALLRKYTLELLLNLPTPGDHNQLIEKGENFIFSDHGKLKLARCSTH
jgi:trimethylamine--corrinoid protein Co-methyltransferase